MRTSVLNTMLAVAVAVGIGACKGPDSLNADLDHYTGNARGANIVPLVTTGPTPTDTAPTGHVFVTTTTDPTRVTAGSVAYSSLSTTGMPGTLDSVALYQVATGANLGPNATVVLCAGAAACAATSGTGVLVLTATATTVRASMRGYGTQVVFFTTTTRAAGAARGTMYTTPQ